MNLPVIHLDRSGGGASGVIAFQYTAINYTDLTTVVAPTANEGQLAIVYASQGVWLVNRKLKGVYMYQSGVWEYANQELQTILQGKLDSVTAGDGIVIDYTNPLEPKISSTIKVPANVTVINTDQDLINSATSYVGGIIEFDTVNRLFLLGAQISLGTDSIRLVDSNMRIFNHSQVASKLTTNATTLFDIQDSSFTIEGFGVENIGGNIISGTDTTGEKIINITRMAFGNCLELVNVTGFNKCDYDNNNIVNINAGITHTDVSCTGFTFNQVDYTRLSGVGAVKLLNIFGVNSDIRLTDDELHSVNAGDKFISVDAGSTYDDILIQLNRASGFDTYPIEGFNAVTAGVVLLAGQNIGITGLMESIVPVANVVSSTSSKYPTYSSTGQSFFIDEPDNINAGSDRIDINLIAEQKISDGSDWWCDLYNYTDGAFVDSPTFPFEFNFDASASDVYEKSESGFQELTDTNYGKSFGSVIAGMTGGGNRTTTQLNSELIIRVYKA